MAVRGLIAASILLATCACGEKGADSKSSSPSENNPKHRIALQDLIEQKKIGYATAVQCIYLADATRDNSVNKNVNDGVRDNAKFYALQTLQSNPGKIEADVGSLHTQVMIATGILINAENPDNSSQAQKNAADRQNLQDQREFKSICIPLFWEKE